jgi:hypothetical protein
VSRYGVRQGRGGGYLEGFLADKALEFLEYGRIAGEILVLTSMGPDLWEFEIGLSTCVIGDIEI